MVLFTEPTAFMCVAKNGKGVVVLKGSWNKYRQSPAVWTAGVIVVVAILLGVFALSISQFWLFLDSSGTGWCWVDCW